MTTAAEVAEHNEKVLRNVERIQLVEKFAESMGCSNAQASTIAKAYAEQFTFDGAVLSFNGTPVTQDKDAVIAHFKDNGLDFLLPKAGETEQPDIDPALLASARNGNQTARTADLQARGRRCENGCLNRQEAGRPQGRRRRQ